MSQIVVDTDVASYIFKWHTLAQQYVSALRGSDPVLHAGRGTPHRRNAGRLERFVHGFELFYPDDDLCTVWTRIRADARAVGRAISPQGRLGRRDRPGVVQSDICSRFR